MADELKIGTKITPEEAAKLDRNKMGIMLSDRPAEGDVTGQYLKNQLTQCPWCGNVGWSVVDTARWNWYTCGRCGGSFRA